MPVYEYVCQDCGHAFEALVFGSERPHCPTCEGARLEKQFSTFATSAEEAPRPVPGPCGSCGDPGGPGACAR
jgi:putative FmdB family regulatory protein